MTIDDYENWQTREIEIEVMEKYGLETPAQAHDFIMKDIKDNVTLNR